MLALLRTIYLLLISSIFIVGCGGFGITDYNAKEVIDSEDLSDIPKTVAYERVVEVFQGVYDDKDRVGGDCKITNDGMILSSVFVDFQQIHVFVNFYDGEGYGNPSYFPGVGRGYYMGFYNQNQSYYCYIHEMTKEEVDDAIKALAVLGVSLY